MIKIIISETLLTFWFLHIINVTKFVWSCRDRLLLLIIDRIILFQNHCCLSYFRLNAFIDYQIQDIIWHTCPTPPIFILKAKWELWVLMDNRLFFSFRFILKGWRFKLSFWIVSKRSKALIKALKISRLNFYFLRIRKFFSSKRWKWGIKIWIKWKLVSSIIFLGFLIFTVSYILKNWWRSLCCPRFLFFFRIFLAVFTIFVLTIIQIFWKIYFRFYYFFNLDHFFGFLYCRWNTVKVFLS